MSTAASTAAAAGTSRRPRALQTVRTALPRGGALSDASWSARHRGITILLWAHVALLVPIGLWRDVSPGEVVVEAGVVAAFALGAMLGRLGRNVRASLATLGLLTCSAILIQFYDGMIELHFHFFVTIAVVALYQAWPPYLIALGFVLLHHTVLGTIAPGEVYDHHAAMQNPGLFALVHGGFILAESIACLVYWKVTEDAMDSEREAWAQLAKIHGDLEQAQELSGVGSWDWDIPAGRVTWSEQHYVLAGVDPATYTPSTRSFLELVHPDDASRVAGLFRTAFETKSKLDYEFRLVRPDGSVRHVHALGEIRTGPDGAVTRFFGTSHDITERMSLLAEVEHMAFHDPLTGLANRRLFLDRLTRALVAYERSGRACAVLFIDLDGFKGVNDRLGHPAGDVLLCEVGRRLTEAARVNDTIARFGGDEFAVLSEDVDVATASRVADRIRDILSQPFAILGTPITPRGSTGIAISAPGFSPDDMLRAADAAMYVAKVRGQAPV